MAGEKLMKLFEQNWSERPFFKKHKEPLSLSEETREKRGESEIPVDQEGEEAVKNFLVERAMSDEKILASCFSGSSLDDLFLSPRSVLIVKESPMKLQTILSGKEVREFSSLERGRILSDELEKEEQRKVKKSIVRTRRGKSMSDLEYEELRGFMDLGFVFSEEDHTNSDLVSVLPGLQRLVKKDEGVVQATEEDRNSGNRVARPYLSEAWDHCGGRKGKKQITPEIKWKVPAPAANEVDLKDHLKLWAHAVASTIR